MTTPLWIIPVQPARTQFKTTLGVLRSHQLEFTTVSPRSLRELLDRELPHAAVVHGGTLTPLLIEVQRWLSEFSVPTLILVEELEDLYEATLLDRGARDVLPLPSSERRLGSRLDVLVRDARQPPAMRTRTASGGSLEIDPRGRAVRLGENLVHVTRTEFDILLTLSGRVNEAVSRSELTEAIGQPLMSARALESHISRLRLKLRRAGAPELLHTLRGVGYRWTTPNPR